MQRGSYLLYAMLITQSSPSLVDVVDTKGARRKDEVDGIVSVWETRYDVRFASKRVVAFGGMAKHLECLPTRLPV